MNHGSKDVQYEYIGEEERNDRKNIKLLVGCMRIMCGKYLTWNVN